MEQKPILKRKWSYWLNLIFTGYTSYSDYENFQECVEYQKMLMDEEKKKYGRYLFSWERQK